MGLLTKKYIQDFAYNFQINVEILHIFLCPLSLTDKTQLGIHAACWFNSNRGQYRECGVTVSTSVLGTGGVVRIQHFRLLGLSKNL